MTKEDRILIENEGLIRSTTYRVANKFAKSKQHINDMDDFLNEARYAAHKAIRTHDENKKAKLSTYIVRCITNRLLDLNRSARRRIPLELAEDMPQCERTVEPTISFGSFLNEKETTVMKKIMLGYTIRDLVTETHVEKKVSKRLASNEVVKCLLHIRQKLTLKDASLNSAML